MVEEGGRLVYANEAISSRRGRQLLEPAPVERIFVAPGGVGGDLPARPGGPRRAAGIEEIRMAPPPSGAARIRLVPNLCAGTSPAAVAARRCGPQRHHPRARAAGERLPGVAARDRLPRSRAGRLPLDRSRRDIVYMNATLASWLGYDLATVGPGGPHLSEGIAPGADMLTGSAACRRGAHGSFDLDLRRRNGHSLPARLYHRIAFGKDGKPGSSRTFVINRSAGTRSRRTAARRRGAVRALPQLPPIAIATLDRSGHIARANASFARLFGVMPRTGNQRRGGARPSKRSWSATAALETALRARQGRGDLPPMDLAEGQGSRSARVWLSPVGEGEAEGGERDPLRPRHYGAAPA